MAINLGNFSTLNVQTDALTHSFAHTVSAGSDYLCYRVTWENNAAAPQGVSAVYWKPAAASQQALARVVFVTSVDDSRSELWSLSGPTIAAGSVDVAWDAAGTGTMWKIMAVEDFGGVRTTGPERATTVKSVQGGSAADPLMTVTAAATDWCLGVMGTEDAAFAGTGVLQTGHSAEALFNDNGAPTYQGVFSRMPGSAVSQTLQFDSSSLNHYSAIVVAIAATAAAGAAETVTGIYTLMTMGMGLALGGIAVLNISGPIGEREAA